MLPAHADSYLWSCTFPMDSAWQPFFRVCGEVKRGGRNRGGGNGLGGGRSMLTPSLDKQLSGICLSPIPGIEGKQEVLVGFFFFFHATVPSSWENQQFCSHDSKPSSSSYLAHPLTSLASLVQCLMPSGHKGAATRSPKDPKGEGGGRRFYVLYSTNSMGTDCALHTAPCKERQKRPMVPALTELSGKEAKAPGVR